MRKLIMFNMVALDGFFEGPNKEIDWHNVDAEFNEFAEEQLKTIEYILFGRVTYELMANYWPTENAVKDDPVIANLMNSAPKIVFSKTLMSADWNNTRLIKENAEGEIRKLKQEEGKDLVIFGSGKLVESFSKLDLIDEYRIIINPVILGKGNPMFLDFERINLKLIKSRTFKSGNVLLYYEKI